MRYDHLFYNIIRLIMIFIAAFCTAIVLPMSFAVQIELKPLVVVLLIGTILFSGIRFIIKNKWLRAGTLLSIYGLATYFNRREIIEGFGMMLRTALRAMMLQYDVHIPEWAEILSNSRRSITIFLIFLALTFTLVAIWEAIEHGVSLLGLLIFAFVIAAVLITGTSLAAVPVLIFVIVSFILAVARQVKDGDEERIASIRLKTTFICAIFFMVAFGLSLLIAKPLHLPQMKTEKMRQEIRQNLEEIRDVVSGKGTLFSNTRTSARTSGGLSDGRLDKAGDLNYSGEEMLEVSTGMLPTAMVYLKGYVSAQFDNNRWYTLDTDDFDTLVGSKENQKVLLNIQSQTLRHYSDADVMKVDNEAAVRGNYAPYGVQINDETIHGDGLISGGQNAVYTFYPEIYNIDNVYLKMMLSSIYYPGIDEDSEQGILLSEYQDFVYQHYTELPEFFDSEAYAQIRNDFTFENSDLNSVAQAIRSGLQSLAVYSLTPERIPSGEDFLPWFLYESKEGYCMHFATAGVLLLRMNGFPARYAEGFICAPGNFVFDGRNYKSTVRDYQAHAWAEVYVDGFGWVPVEMTPGYSSADNITNNIHNQNGIQRQSEENSIETESGAESSESNAESENDNTPGRKTSESAVPDNNSDTGNSEDSYSDELLSGDHMHSGSNHKFEMPKWLVNSVKAVAVILFFVTIVILWTINRRNYYKKILNGKNYRRAILVLYNSMNRWLHLAGIKQPYEKTGQERVAAVENMPHVSSEMFTAFETVAWKAAFAKEKMTAEEYQVAKTAYETVTKEIYEQLPWYKRASQHLLSEALLL